MVGGIGVRGTLEINIATGASIALTSVIHDFDNNDGNAANDAGTVNKTGAGTLILGGVSTYSGGTTISAGTLQVGGGGTTGSITGNIANNSALAFNRSDAVTFAGTISGTGTLQKLGAGVLTLSAANSYAGTTAVDAGTLLVTGSPTGTGAITVAAGAALGGTGAVASAVTVTGTFSAGGTALSDIGTLATGALTLDGTATYRQDINGTTAADRISVTGAVTINSGATLDLEGLSAFTTAAGQAVGLIANDGVDGVTGTFGNLVINGSGATATTPGATFAVNGRSYRISYAGNISGSTVSATGGNDVVLVDVTAPPPSDPDPTPAGPTSGDDNLVGTAGPDTISLGLGNDTFAGGAGNDLVYGNQGNDLIYGNQDADTLYGGQGDDRAFGGQGDDRLFGNLGNDVLSGNLGNDIVYGNQGADIVYGNQGADILFGGQGNDVLYGGQGADTLVGGIGDDTLVGGLGADLYRFDPNSGRDLILGFNQGEGDRIALGGQTYTVSSAQNGDALLLLSGGGVVDLAGIRADQVNAAYFAG